MAPLLPPAAAVLPLRAASGPTTTPPCVLAPALGRLFLSSTPSSPRQRQRIPPESPLFINVPNPPQDQSIEAKRELKRARGSVPVPRRIFAHRDSHRKPTEAWLARAAPEARSPRPDPATELQAWRRAMADSRRENMRSGVRDLWARKQRLDERLRSVRTAKLAANRAAALAPEREDERLTRGTVNAGTLQTAVVLDPDRFERAAESAARTAAIAAVRSEARRDALQTLYMNARDFIIDEARLEHVVNTEFADDHFQAMGASGTGYRIENIWDAQNEPIAVAGMLREAQRNHDKLITDLTTEETRTVRRQKLAAEELTGGKME
ncbi:hypothetical protein SAMD00023353_0700030 [Rosellinia necatrix]|uniref:Uncharacterized protein n=1 Tax=Rosellinia necatrix TaxID=77044 RepID=A0A1S7ULL6_ROSNE|nr:hypothetical protein SAMD00023353_0700030 [Rosellinia necatrix]